ncbi:MAG: D-sedoheptulose 7-phosphate isomerase [Bacteroidetes bacterium]|nr:D-sedoheptulose 7-phosphate isomerase [Bacteroidota bacterium]
MKNHSIPNTFLEASEILQQFISDENNFINIRNAGDLIAGAVRKGRKVISCGNGGSMCDAMHFAEELSGRFRKDRKALPAISVSDPSHITCTANDYGFEKIFSRYIEAIGEKGDILLAISTSGNSENVIQALKAARKKKMKIIGLTGKDGGRMAGKCDVEIRAPHSKYSDRAQEIHIKVIHALIEYVEDKLGLLKRHE